MPVRHRRLQRPAGAACRAELESSSELIGAHRSSSGRSARARARSRGLVPLAAAAAVLGMLHYHHDSAGPGGVSPLEARRRLSSVEPGVAPCSTPDLESVAVVVSGDPALCAPHHKNDQLVLFGGAVILIGGGYIKNMQAPLPFTVMLVLFGVALGIWVSFDTSFTLPRGYEAYRYTWTDSTRNPPCVW